jgi:hypothetical protein
MREERCGVPISDMQRAGQSASRRAVGGGPYPALEITDRAFADAGTLGQLGLRQACSDAQSPDLPAE